MTVCLERLEEVPFNYFPQPMSALSPKADRQQTPLDVRFMPEADIGKRWPTSLPQPLFRSMLPPRVRAKERLRSSAFLSKPQLWPSPSMHHLKSVLGISP